MRLVRALKGGGFMAALLCLIFFLKVICPIEVGCLADPFLLVFFAPLSFFSGVFFIPVAQEPLFILGFWMLAGMLVGFLAPTSWNSNEEDEDEEELIKGESQS